MNYYWPIFDGSDALDSVRLAVLLHVWVDVRVVCHEVRLRAAVRRSAELERRLHLGRLSQLSARAKSKPKLTTYLLVHKIDGFLKRSYRYGFTSKLITMQPFINSTTEDLFCKMQRSSHCLYPLLPPDRERSYSLRDRGHSFQLPTCHYNLHKKSFVISCLFEFLT